MLILPSTPLVEHGRSICAVDHNFSTHLVWLHTSTTSIRTSIIHICISIRTLADTSICCHRLVLLLLLSLAAYPYPTNNRPLVKAGWLQYLQDVVLGVCETPKMSRGGFRIRWYTFSAPHVSLTNTVVCFSLITIMAPSIMLEAA